MPNYQTLMSYNQTIKMYHLHLVDLDMGATD